MSKTNYEGKTRYQREEIADGYDNRRFTSLKGRITNRLEMSRINDALQVANVTGEVLDLPCGTGRMTEMLLEKGFQVTAADISEEMMKHARQKTSRFGDQVSFEICDVENLKFPENRFELILTMRLIHHIPPDLHNRILTQLWKTTAKWVIISFSNKYSLQNIRRNIISLFTKFPRYSISVSRFKKEARAAGFKICKLNRLLPMISESVIVLLEKQESRS